MINLANVGGNLPQAKGHQGDPLAVANLNIATPATSLTVEDFASMMDASKTSLLKEVCSRVKEEMDVRFKATNTTTPSFSPNEVLDADGDNETLLHPKPTTAQSYNTAEHSYAPQPIPCPHINSHGSLTPLNTKHFAEWKLGMECHIRGAAMQLWLVTINSCKPRTQQVLLQGNSDDQLNATALNMLH